MNKKSLMVLPGCAIAALILLSCSPGKQNVASSSEELARNLHARAIQKEMEGDYFGSLVALNQAESLFEMFDGDSLKELILSDHVRLEESRENARQRAGILLQAYERSERTDSPENVFYLAARSYDQAGETALADSLYALIKQINPEFDFQIPPRTISLKDSLRRVEDSLQNVQISLYEKRARHAQERSEYLSQENKRFRQVLTSICFVLVLILISAAFIIMRIRARNREETLRLMSIAEQTKGLLFEVELEKDSYKSKYISKFKDQFSLLRQIAETSLTAQKRTDGEAFLKRKIEELTKMVTDDRTGHQDFEAILNKEMDGVMEKYRHDFPNKQEKTYWLISFLIAGFDATAISLLLDYSPESVYVIKSRLVKEIRESSSESKEQLLALLS